VGAFEEPAIVKAESAILVDTDILIDYLRGMPPAMDFLEASGADLNLSVVNVAELHAGVRDHEREAVNALLECFKIIPLDKEIAVRGGLLRRDFGKSHGVELADALIAATVESLGCTLATLNRKHYPMLSSVMVPYTKE
jgi:predicted nucleic acid-binding protein